MSNLSEPAQLAAAEWVVLIVDDNPDNTAIIEVALSFYGATVYTAGSGEDGLSLLNTIQPTVILLDLSMPKLSGWEVFKQIRENPDNSHIPVIAVTAHAMPEDRRKVFDAGFDGYITKPFNIVSFVGEIQKIIGGCVQ